MYALVDVSKKIFEKEANATHSSSLFRIPMRKVVLKIFPSINKILKQRESFTPCYVKAKRETNVRQSLLSALRKTNYRFFVFRALEFPPIKICNKAEPV